MKSIYSADYKKLIEWLVSKRLLAGITQAQLAENLNKLQSFVSKYENAERRLMSLFSPNLLEILSCGHQKTLLINGYLPDLPVLAISANDVIILISSCLTIEITCPKGIGVSKRHRKHQTCRIQKNGAPWGQVH
jgi:transcriptional regulator with XRE-family HTH domain